EVRDHEIERGFRERQPRSVSAHEVRVLDRPALTLPSRACQALRPWVEAHDARARTEALRQLEQRKPGAAPEVECRSCGEWHVLEQEAARERGPERQLV